MNNFTSVHDVQDVHQLVNKALALKSNPLKNIHLGRNKTLGLIFMNPSLRTRLSSQRAATNLGMNVITLNAGQESWALEFNDGAVMNGTKVEHVKDAAAIIGMYCDIVAIRCFPGLVSREEDHSEAVLSQFIKYCPVPVVSLESATRHPLQSFADLITIAEHTQLNKQPRIVLTWAPHIKPLPQAVANSFSEWVIKAGYPLTIAQPQGYELSPEFTMGATVTYDQREALQDADFVYAKNWSSYNDYGQMLPTGTQDWLLTQEKMKLTNQGKIMHCLPVRRNVEVPDALLDGEHSLILKQAENRIYAAQTIFKLILQTQLATCAERELSL
jgi:N-succinyl-L-ornithine transcarbamylase